MPPDEPFDPRFPIWSPGYILFRPHPFLRGINRLNRKVHDPWPFTVTAMPRAMTIRDVCTILAERVHRDRRRWMDVVLFWDGIPLQYDALASQSFRGEDNRVDRTTRGMFCLYGAVHPEQVKREARDDTRHWTYEELLWHEAPGNGEGYPEPLADNARTLQPPRAVWVPAA